jgi:hypothetical protein
MCHKSAMLFDVGLSSAHHGTRFVHAWGIFIWTPKVVIKEVGKMKTRKNF